MWPWDQKTEVLSFFVLQIIAVEKDIWLILSVSTGRKWRELPFDASFCKIGSHLLKKSVVEFHSLVSVSSKYRSQSVALDTFIPLMTSLCSYFEIQPFFPVTSVSKSTKQKKKEWLNATALNQKNERVNHWFIVYSIIANRFSVIWLKWKNEWELNNFLA